MKIKRIVCGIEQRILKFLYGKRSNDIFVLMFHEVVDNNEEFFTENHVSLEKFKYFIERLKVSDVNFCSINDFLSLTGKRIIITFDDIFKSVYRNAIPVLEKFNIPFTIFVSENLVDTYGYISSEELIKLKNNPLCTIGFHTKSHKLMSKLSKKEILDEIDASSFENKYDIKCDYFAYPYGSTYACTHKVRKILSKSTYKMSFGTVCSSTNSMFCGKKYFFVPRINIVDSSIINTLKKIYNK